MNAYMSILYKLSQFPQGCLSFHSHDRHRRVRQQSLPTWRHVCRRGQRLHVRLCGGVDWCGLQQKWAPWPRISSSHSNPPPLPQRKQSGRWIWKLYGREVQARNPNINFATDCSYWASHKFRLSTHSFVHVRVLFLIAQTMQRIIGYI